MGIVESRNWTGAVGEVAQLGLDSCRELMWVFE